MLINRTITDSYYAKGHLGFMGPDHIARTVIQFGFPKSDPFIMLMDDFLDKSTAEPVGGAHPHAGFEIVSILLEGRMEGIEAGGMQILTTGSGIVHTESIQEKALLRLMQLWINIPKESRNTAPKLQDIKIDKIPKINSEGVNIKVYSGSISGVTSPVVTSIPLIIADISLDANVETTLRIPADFTTFLYTIEGDVLIGDTKKHLKQYEVGWLDTFSDNELSNLYLKSNEQGARILLYSAKPLGEDIVSRGPFIADSESEIVDLYHKYRQGQFPHISTFHDDNLVQY